MEGSQERPFAVVTGASSGIGYELAGIFGENGFDLHISNSRKAEMHRQMAEPGSAEED